MVLTFGESYTIINRSAKIKRGVAQLVARLLWEQDVGGSNPFTPRNENPVTQVAGFSLLYDSFLSFQFSVKRDRIF